MMRQYELVERVARYNPDVDETLLNKAYIYAMQKHGLQTRASGDPYFSHPLEVAAILTELKVDDATIAVALLHDTIEDTDATRQEIDAIFGEEIGRLVEALTKLKRLDFVSKKTQQAENFRRLLIAVAADIRVLLVKLADRLHNMRTLNFVPVPKRRAIAEETMEIYAPLAGRMGMQRVRDELEDLAFQHLNPEAHSAIGQRLKDLRERNRGLIEAIEKELTEKLAGRGIKAQVRGREKRPYSIFTKMQRKSVGFEQLSDIYGFRLTVRTVEECYRALGAIHTIWSMVPGRFKDYISTPKQNDYRSIHTTVIGPGRQRVELQIRTEDMHRIAEYGVAAHALYKEGDSIRSRSLPQLATESGAYAWLRETIDRLDDPNLNPEEFLENTKLELFHDQVFCFTPKGRIVALPRGATPIDFAYAVHTDIGNTCVGCKINGRISPLVTELANGDEVEIIRSRAQVPPLAWEQIAVTGKARAAIRRATKEAARRQYSGLGRQILERAFQRHGRAYDEGAIATIVHRLGMASVADVTTAVGKGELDSAAVMRAVFPDWKEERQTPKRESRKDGWFRLPKAAGMMFRVPDAADGDGRAISVHGVGDLPVRCAPGSGAVPGDRIVGILTPGEGITVYPITSPALKEFDDQPERWLDVRWAIDESNSERFPAQITLTSLNEPGSLAQIAQVIADHSGNIDNVRMVRKGPDFHEMVLDLEVWDVKHLNRIIATLKTKPIISHVARVNG